MKRPVIILVLLSVLAAIAGCGGGSEAEPPAFPSVVTLGKVDIAPQLLNTALTVGDNRLSLGLLDKQNEPILGAEVNLRFFDLNGQAPELKAEMQARFVAMRLSYIDEEAQGRKREVGQSGVYVAQVRFDRPGRWGVEITPQIDGKKQKPMAFQFNVLERSPEVMVGEPAPASRQLTLNDVADICEIDTSHPSRPHMHNTTVAEALRTGKPLVVAFATPAFCESRTCGPVMDVVMDPLYEKYRDQAVFIHIEPFRL
ncbi:MAG TPA: hypothetical protein VNL15_05385, partial [Dehalococcoidia bacterium]|nr:hypothetical protein [Dehalococcoidia bacterium]